MTNKKLFWFLLGAITFLLYAFMFMKFAYASTTYPSPNNYINDTANVIDDATEAKLNSALASFEKRTTNQIGVLTIDTTGNESIEEYSIHIADRWKFGQKGKDNGVIIIFAMKDHKMRIEVGRGLEGQLTDIQAKHILDDDVTPELKAGNTTAGVVKAVGGVIHTIDPSASESSLIASTSATLTSNGKDVTPGIATIIVVLVIVLLIVFFIAASDDDGTGFGGGLLAGGILSGMGDGGEGEGGGGGGGGFSGGGGGGFSGGGASGSW